VILAQVLGGIGGILVGAAILVPMSAKMYGLPVWKTTKEFWTLKW